MYSHKHLGILVNTPPIIQGHLLKLLYILPKSAFIIICKGFVMHHVRYGDTFFDKALNNYFLNKIKSIPCNGCLLVTGAIKGTSKVKIY